MKKSLIVLAVLGAMGSPVFAQTSLTAYGVVDAGVVHDRDNVSGGGNRTGLDSGIQAGSRVGFRGTEDLGSGISAIFTLEMGMAIDTGATTQGATFGRQTYLGLQSDWGRVTLGRQYTPYYLALSGVADPFAGGLAGTAENLMWRSGTRMDNTIKYVLPEWGGFSAELAYSFKEIPITLTVGVATADPSVTQLVPSPSTWLTTASTTRPQTYASEALCLRAPTTSMWRSCMWG